MKLIHTSDWHLGRSSPLGDYRECQEFFFEQLYDLIRREKVDAVLCAGDVYDTVVSNAEAIHMFNRVVTTLCQELGVTFIVIAGNHDGASRLSSYHELLEKSNMYVVGDLKRGMDPILLDGGKVAVYALPYFLRDHVTALFPEEKERIRTVEEGTRFLCDRLREGMPGDRRNIILSHAYIVDAELSESDRAAKVGTAAAISKDIFEGFDYVALGHIHKPQVIAEHIRYSGSPVKYSFGTEEGQEKGVVLIDTDTMEQRFITIPQFRDRKTVTGTYEELMQREDLRELYLRIEVTDRYAGPALLGEMQEQFPYMMELKGKQVEGQEGDYTLTLEDVRAFDEVEMMIKFIEECYEGFEITEEHIQEFREALEDCDREEGTVE